MDEKKKLIVLIALIAVMACVGGFTLLKPKPAPPPPPPATAPIQPPSSDASADLGAAKGSARAKAKESPIKNPEVANELPGRDPFSVPPGARPRNNVPTIAPIAHNTPVPQMGGLRPLPMQGSFGQMNPLPSSGSAPTHVSDERPFGYTVVGSITGERPAVVLQDSSGNQKLVPVGSAIDADSRVKRVENGAVMIEYRGKTLRFTVGGISVDK